MWTSKLGGAETLSVSTFNIIWQSNHGQRRDSGGARYADDWLVLIAITYSRHLHQPGKRTTVHPKPMQPLSAIISTVLDTCQIPVNATECQLQHNGICLDTSTLFRYANIPSNAKLVLLTGREPTLGVRQSPEKAVQPTHTTAATLTTTVATLATTNTTAQQPLTVREAPNDAQQDTAKSPPIYIFHRQDLITCDEHQGLLFNHIYCHNRLSAADDEPDEFYTFTEADYHAVTAGYAARAKHQSEPLKTKAMRDAEVAARAAAFPAVRVRVQLPDGHIVQSEFAGSEPLSAVRARLQPLLVPGSASGAWYLYTAPPKKPIRDETKSLYALQLVPAALLYVGCQGQVDGAWVLEDALREHGGVPPDAQPRVVEHALEKQAEKPAKAHVDGGRKGVPKWMRL